MSTAATTSCDHALQSAAWHGEGRLRQPVMGDSGAILSSLRGERTLDPTLTLLININCRSKESGSTASSFPTRKIGNRQNIFSSPIAVFNRCDYDFDHL